MSETRPTQGPPALIRATAERYYNLRQEFYTLKATPHAPGKASEKYEREKRLKADLKACEDILKAVSGPISPWQGVWLYEFVDPSTGGEGKAVLFADYWASKVDPNYPNGAGSPTTNERIANLQAADAEFARHHPGVRSSRTKFVRVTRRETGWA